MTQTKAAARVVVSKIVEGVFVPRLNSPNERVWNDRLWRKADIRRSGEVRNGPNCSPMQRRKKMLIKRTSVRNFRCNE